MLQSLSVAQVSDNPYKVLGVERSASEVEIKSAYRKLAMQHHPDRNPGDVQAEERFKQVSEAYAILRDPAARARYDSHGSAAPRPDFNNMDWQSVFREADVHVNWDRHQGMPRTGSSVFDMLFGVVSGMMRRSGLLPGEHRELTAAIPLKLARSGGTTHVHIKGPSVCPECRGSGSVDRSRCQRCAGSGVLRGGSVVELTVPAGVGQGRKLRLRGVGGPGNPPGDALVTLNIQVPSGTTLRGSDIHTDVYVAPFEAGNGLNADVLGQNVRIPAGTRNGQTVRVPGGGLGGDLIVTVRHDLLRGLWRSVRGMFSGNRGMQHG